MAKKSKHRRARPAPSRRTGAEPSATTNTSEVVTVAWMLGLLATLVAEVTGILIRLLTLQIGVSDRLHALSGTLLMVAFVAGLLTLLLTPLTLKLRPVPPPRPIVVSAVVIGVIPVLTVLILALE